MTQEEKAKAYDEALRKVKDMLSYKEVRREDMEYIFPELKESEDERIRRQTLKVLNYYKDEEKSEGRMPTEIDECIAWLEKQGEKKSLDDIAKEVTKDKDAAIPFLKSTGIMNENGELADEYKIEQGEQKPAWSEEDEKILSNIIKDLAHPWNEYIPDRIEDEIKWLKNKLKSLKDRLQPQLKQEWNEEDEIARNDIIAKLAILKSRAVDGGAEKEICEMEIKWLKSLKDRYTWKPSDEQMDALHYVTNFDYGGYKATLVSLYEQLKRLNRIKL